MNPRGDDERLLHRTPSARENDDDSRWVPPSIVDPHGRTPQAVTLRSSLKLWFELVRPLVQRRLQA